MIVLESAVSNYVYSKGRRYSYFAGNNYLGLADHSSVKEAVIQSVEKYGVNFSASRRTTGTAGIHLELEKMLAAFKGRDDAVIYASGYQGNGILLEVLRDRYDTVCVDSQAHPSIMAAIPHDIVKVLRYNHCDAGNLERLLNDSPGAAPLVITDGIFALSGEIAPLDKIWPVVKKHNGILVVDDAHSTGVLGNTGKGTPEYFNLHSEKDIFQSETMSKALGSYGGFLCGSREFTEAIRDTSATYQGSTSLPPAVVAAGMAALKVINDTPALRTDLLARADSIRQEILTMGLRTTITNTPIIPVLFSSREKAVGVSQYLEENGLIVPFMNYPGSEDMHMIRIAVSALHTAEQADELVTMLKKWINRHGKD